MALLKIARMGNPILRRRAAEVADPTDPDLHRLIDDMIETMLDAPGVGLAAPQVHADLRLIVFRVPAERLAPGEIAPPGGVTALINPQITVLDPETDPGWEGCLSVPDLRGSVPRFRRIGYRGLAPDGSVIEREAGGFHARVVQHETDHLDGVLYLDRMPDLQRLCYVDEMHNFDRA